MKPWLHVKALMVNQNPSARRTVAGHQPPLKTLFVFVFLPLSGFIVRSATRNPMRALGDRSRLCSHLVGEAQSAKTGAGEETMETRWWSKLEDKKVRCELCPRQCIIADGRRGFCYVRENRGGELVLDTYGRSTGFCIDPIEKKPLSHFFPGSAVMSFGTAGCNLSCAFCQNWTSSRARAVDASLAQASPKAIAQLAQDSGCQSVAFTYNDPVIFAEYALDTAAHCHDLGLKTVAVSAGYIEAKPRAEFFAAMDAANIDLKAFSGRFYRELCGGEIAVVQETLRHIAQESDCWLEVTTLLITGANDGDDEIKRLSAWLLQTCGPDLPLHFSAYHPAYKLNAPATSPERLRSARRLALNEGLRYVYTGNIRDPEGQSTYCPACGERVVARDGYHIGEIKLHIGANGSACCAKCGEKIAGHFEAEAGKWGARRVPVEVS